MLTPPLYTLRHMVGILEALDIPYLVGGSVASVALSEPRSTNDVDIVVDLREENVVDFLVALEDDFYAEEEMIRDAISLKSSFNLILLRTMIKVDVFVCEANAWTESEFSRKHQLDLGITGEPILAWLPSAEDVILQKLAWYRLGGEVSERQWRDVQGVLKVQAENLDYDYLKKWAIFRNVSDLLLRAVYEASLITNINPL
ncbi:MAG: hypothetical protein H7308_14110 [Chthonomonadaceae bacterium]|nr:hypothetical protein [Chthonomonadaceae bacterium]